MNHSNIYNNLKCDRIKAAGVLSNTSLGCYAYDIEMHDGSGIFLTENEIDSINQEIINLRFKGDKELTLSDYLRFGYPYYKLIGYHKDLSDKLYEAVGNIIKEPNKEKESLVILEAHPQKIYQCKNLESWFIEGVAKLFAAKSIQIKDGLASIERCTYNYNHSILYHIAWFSLSR